MKKFSFLTLAGLFLFSIVFTGSIYAQGGVQNANSFAKLNEASIPSASLSMINDRAVKEFRKSFNPAAPESWAVIADGYTATFDDRGKKTTVYYTPKGHWAGTVRQLSEKDLPKDVWGAFKSNYYDFNINFVREIKLRDHLVYIAYMENAEAFKNVKLIDGALEVLEEFKK